MPNGPDQNDSTLTGVFSTTLVREGHGASTEEELVRFAQEVARRPIRQLLEDLPGLVRLSRGKFDFVVGSIRERIDRQPLAVRERMIAMIRIWAEGTTDTDVAARLREICEPGTD